MTREEAIKILDPETSLQELGRIAYYGGFMQGEAVEKAAKEARLMAIEALRHVEELEAEIDVLNWTIEKLSKERPKGRWISNGIPESTLRGCSACGYTCGAYTFNYCPNCGADMRGEEE